MLTDLIKNIFPYASCVGFFASIFFVFGEWKKNKRRFFVILINTIVPILLFIASHAIVLFFLYVALSFEGACFIPNEQNINYFIEFMIGITLSLSVSIILLCFLCKLSSRILLRFSLWMLIATFFLYCIDISYQKIIDAVNSVL